MPSLIDNKIANCKSWADFEQLVAAHEKTKDKGDLFERLTQLFLQTSTTYSSKIKHVWWCNNPYTNEFPEAVRQKLNLPAEDEGIDLICETFEGKYWSVQAKYRTDNDKALTTKELSKFLSLSFVTSGQIELGLITHTSTKPVRKQDLMGHTTELGLQNFLEMSPEQWDQIAGICANNAPLPPIARTPEPFQGAAIANAIKHFQSEDNARGKLIMPCGTGKSLMAYWMAREMNAKSIILAVPSLALVKQSLGDWTAEFLAEGIRPEWLAVCSDDSVGSMKEADSTVSTVYEAGIPATTDQFEIVEFLEKTTDVPKVIFTTYQSSKVLAEACTAVGFTVDLLIADEAHKTVGSSAKKFATLLSDDNIHINRRLFMTATERVIRGAGEGEVVSMDDVSVYGEVFHQMSFAEAIREKIICDYKILTLFVSENETSDLVSQRQTVEVQQGNRKIETDAHSLAVGLAVEKAFKKYGVKRAITFHSSIKRAENFVNQQREFGGLVDEDIEIDYQTVSSKQTAGQRSRNLNNFKSKDSAVLSNARCLTEGVDIPSIDCVAFVDPKQSVVDIVQAAGRAMRKSDETGKNYGYILIPISVPLGVTLEEFSDTSDFKAVTKVITALSTQDERIAEELRVGFTPKGDDRVLIEGDYFGQQNIDFNEFAQHIRTELWKPLAKANWPSFEQARKFVQSLKLKNVKDWQKWLASDHRRQDIPSNPDKVYASKGWVNYGDWLGNGALSSSDKSQSFMSFQEAKEFVGKQGFKNTDQFFKWSKSSERPHNFPGNPYSAYADDGWINYPHFLGYGIEWRPFEDARKFARKLGFSGSKDWFDWAGSDKRPSDIPYNPSKIYHDSGWLGFADWLGIPERRNKSFLTFEEARRVASEQGFKKMPEFKAWKKRPYDIPSNPKKYYAEEWRGWPDFLGYAALRGRVENFLSFEDASKFIKSKEFVSANEYLRWHRKEKPENLPANPPVSYQKKGWKGWPHFLTGNVKESFLSFEQARKFVHSLGLKSYDDYRQMWKAGNLPNGLPGNPRGVYKEEWLSTYDFIGKIAPNNDILSFDEARQYVHKLGLKRVVDWEEWCASGKRPLNIPAHPRHAYPTEWSGFRDWLGTQQSSTWEREEDPKT